MSSAESSYVVQHIPAFQYRILDSTSPTPTAAIATPGQETHEQPISDALYMREVLSSLLPQYACVQIALDSFIYGMQKDEVFDPDVVDRLASLILKDHTEALSETEICTRLYSNTTPGGTTTTSTTTTTTTEPYVSGYSLSSNEDSRKDVQPTQSVLQHAFRMDGDAGDSKLREKDTGPHPTLGTTAYACDHGGLWMSLEMFQTLERYIRDSGCWNSTVEDLARAVSSLLKSQGHPDGVEHRQHHSRHRLRRLARLGCTLYKIFTQCDTAHNAKQEDKISAGTVAEINTQTSTTTTESTPEIRTSVQDHKEVIHISKHTSGNVWSALEIAEDPDEQIWFY